MGNFDFARQGQLVNIEDYGKIAISVTTVKLLFVTAFKSLQSLVFLHGGVYHV